MLGTLVWDPLIGKPKFDHPGMPEHIFNAFLDAEIISDENWKQLMNNDARAKAMQIARYITTGKESKKSRKSIQAQAYKYERLGQGLVSNLLDELSEVGRGLVCLRGNTYKHENGRLSHYDNRGQFVEGGVANPMDRLPVPLHGSGFFATSNGDARAFACEDFRNDVQDVGRELTAAYWGNY